MLFAGLYLFIGFLLLWKGGDYLVDSSVQLAKKFHVPEFIIGLTMVAFGTSAPELIVNMFASLDGKPDIVYGNVLGSNIANLLFILGVCGSVFVISVKDSHLLQDLWVSIGALLVLVVCLCLPIGPALSLTPLKGMIMLVFFAGYMGHLILSGPKPEGLQLSSGSTYRLMGLFIVGLVGLLGGAKLAVEGVTIASKTLGLSETFLSLFVLAVGTSLPELFATWMSVKKGQSSLAFGNIIGSNIFNIMLVLPMSALVGTLTFHSDLFFEIGLIAVASMAIPLLFYIRKKNDFPRLFLAMYGVIYVGYIVFIGSAR